MQESDLLGMIADAVEESLTLDYKAASALAHLDRSKKEIAKDVSAMANAAGGTLIYGIKEYDDPSRRHLPERLDPIDRRQFTREWLEHVVQNIRPRIDAVIIEPVALSTGLADVAYVVHVPQSTTAHQASDFRYYRRYNFESVPMYDHEVRDVMGRRQHPKVGLIFSIGYRTIKSWSTPLAEPSHEGDCFLRVAGVNRGNAVAQFIAAFVYVPLVLIAARDASKYQMAQIDGADYVLLALESLRRDANGGTAGPFGVMRSHASPVYAPLLPRLSRELETVSLQCDFHVVDPSTAVHWSVFADNAAPEHGVTALSEMQVSELLK